MDILDRLLEHNAWATRQLIEHCRGLSPNEFTQSFAIGPGNVHDTLLHIVTAMQRWANRIGGGEIRPSPRSDRHTCTPEELVRELEIAHADVTAAAQSVADAGRLDEMMELTVDGHRYEFTRGTAITHVLTHGMHHRAQVFNMLRHLGRMPAIDGDAIEWEIATRSK